MAEVTESGGWAEIGAQAVRLTGNEPTVLAGESRLRYVESGALALFCGEVRNGSLVGPRNFLDRIEAGQAALSLPVPTDGDLQLMYVPIREANVQDVQPADGDPRAVPDGVRVVEGWVELLSGLIPSFTDAEEIIPSEGDEQIELDEDEAMTVDEATDVVWCRVLAGEVWLMGSPDRSFKAGDELFPLTSATWACAAGGPATVVTLQTQTLPAPALLGALKHLQTLVIGVLRVQFKRKEQAELYRAEESRRLQNERAQEALKELVSAIDAGDDLPAKGTAIFKAMQIAARWLGVDIEQRESWETGRRGSDPVETIARSARLRLRRVTLRGKWWRQDCGALLGFSFEDGDPVAVLPVRGGYEIVNPEDGTRTKVDTKEAAEWLAPEAMMIYRPLPEGRLKLMDLIRFSMARRRPEMTIILWTGLVATLLGMLTPQAVAILFDHAIPESDGRLLLELGAALLAAAFGAAVFRVSQGIVVSRLSLASEAEVQAAVWDRVLRLRPSFFRGFTSGDLQSRVMAVSDVGREFSGTTLSTLFASLMAILNLGLLFYYSPKLAVLGMSVGLIVAIVTTSVSFVIRKNMRELMEIDGTFFGMVVQLVNSVGKLRVAGAEERAYTFWLSRFAEKLGLRATIAQLNERIAVFNQIVPTLTTACVFLIAHDMIVQGRVAGSGGLTLGTFMAFNVALTTFLNGTIGISNSLTSFLDIGVKGRRVKPILDQELEVDVSKTDPGPLAGGLEVVGLDFSYKEGGPKTLDAVNLRADPGEFIAVVGPSGSGKSTLFRALLGFEVPDDGTIYFDGKDLSNLDLLAIRRQLGVVLQGGKLDPGSIFENIASGNIISLDEAWAAAEDAGCADEIRDMPMGMHTYVSVGGGTLSGGQRQRILIARALAHRPRILLFDEATSALDNRTQAIVSESLERLNITRIVVAHRLSTVRNAARIYVLDRGRIMQSGSFAELMTEKDGLFARMMKRQLA